MKTLTQLGLFSTQMELFPITGLVSRGNKKTLTLTLKKQWFDLIYDGVKTTEFRENKPYWQKRLIEVTGQPKVFDYVFNSQLDKLVDFLFDKIIVLESSGVDFGAIASNTPHIVFDRLAEKTAIPLISIVEETCKE